VTVVDRADRGRGAHRLDDAVPAVDALVTADPDVVLVTLVADCVPIALLDPAAGVLATVHAGWRGTVAGVSTAALDAMAARGARPERVVAALGPCVPQQGYQVGAEVAESVRRCLGAAATDVLQPDGDEHWRVDLAGTNALLLARAGVPPEHIAVCPAVTGGEGPFFSDRQARPCGRFALLSRLRPYDGGPAAT
jgi:YfiH family protein